MQFDEAQYVENFVKKHRGTRGVPGDPMARYAITLPATDVEIAAQVKAVREYWNKASRGMSNISQVAKLCRAEDERLRAQHGTKMETRAWWLERQSDQQKAAEASITVMVDDLRRHYGTLGVVTPGVLNQFAAKLGLTPAQATQAAERAGLKVITGLSLPDTEPIGNFAALLKSMSECAVPSVPELVHPGSGPFSLVDRYECRSYPEKRLDVSAVEAQCAEADRRGISATEDARRSALKIVRKAVRDGVDLRDVALYHMVTIARESLSLSIDMAAEELRKTGLEAADAAAIAVLVAEQNTRAGGAGKDRVDSLLASGRLREARAAAMGLQAESGLRSDAMQLVDAAQRRPRPAALGGRGGAARPRRGSCRDATERRGADQRRGRRREARDRPAAASGGTSRGLRRDRGQALLAVRARSRRGHHLRASQDDTAAAPFRADGR